jgi:hypothetical protein
MWHVQPKTPVHCNNSTAVGIANSMVKQQQSCLMKMHFSGLVTSVHKKCTHFTGIQARRILRIIRANITQERIMQLSAHII